MVEMLVVDGLSNKERGNYSAPVPTGARCHVSGGWNIPNLSPGRSQRSPQQGPICTPPFRPARIPPSRTHTHTHSHARALPHTHRLPAHAHQLLASLVSSLPPHLAMSDEERYATKNPFIDDEVEEDDEEEEEEEEEEEDDRRPAKRPRNRYIEDEAAVDDDEEDFDDEDAELVQEGKSKKKEKRDNRPGASRLLTLLPTPPPQMALSPRTSPKTRLARPRQTGRTGAWTRCVAGKTTSLPRRSRPSSRLAMRVPARRKATSARSPSAC